MPSIPAEFDLIVNINIYMSILNSIQFTYNLSKPKGMQIL